jgi:hypothetical protein
MDVFKGPPEGRGFTGCGKKLNCCHPEPVAVILSAAKNLALSIFNALRDSSFARLRTAAAPQNGSAFEFFRSR